MTLPVTHSLLQAGPAQCWGSWHTDTRPPDLPCVRGPVTLDTGDRAAGYVVCELCNLKGPSQPSRGDSPTKLCRGRPLLWRAQHCLGIRKDRLTDGLDIFR